ncbi:ATP-dependent RecD-like DNA helicase [Prevotella sp. E13-27]|uniref:SF1B family DNA helicase RecD2 n=1 Tax=Prevotella sp. E13-27 TaxID=2938122 RepID=UPI00200A56E4|nr:ATP-dependent RecD-like DNA helicase [Prevotella sp. E13-27]MCK8621467.1 ATP-dependent RecD-like DNA helicase [Prevotella sp. E13-27]
MEKIKCTIERITFQNPENGYSVLQATIKGYREEQTLVGTFHEVTVGAVLTVEGTWRVDKRYGRQFAVEKWTEELPADIIGIEKYLGSGLVKGIGPKFAKLIVAKFGLDTFNVIENEPDKLLEVYGIGKGRVAKIQASWEKQKDVKDIMVFLQGHGVSSTYAAKIYKQYGKESIEKVQANPYCLADDIWGIGFKTADGIAEKLGYEKNDLRRCRSGIFYTLNKLSEDGHVYSEREQLIKSAKELLQAEEEPITQALDDMITKEDLILDEEAIFLPPFYYAEIGVASKLKRLLEDSTGNLFDGTLNIEEIVKKTGIQYDDVQVAAIQQAVKSKVMVLTGGPGTGKTVTTQGIIAALESLGQGILLAAPTGRAAKRMNEATGKEAKTIHRLLEYNPAEGYGRNDENPLDGGVLIVDESSMIDVILMNSLLKAVPSHMRLILVGDIDQLPSVGAGNVLRDIIDSGVVPVIRLTKIFRQAQTSRIITNAHKINQGIFPDISNGRDADFFFIKQEDPEKAAQEIVNIVKNRIPKAYHYSTNDIQVLAPMQRSVVGATNLNIILQEAINPEGDFLSRGGFKYRKGDRVMQIRNNYDKEVFNGDIGIVQNVNMEDRSLTVIYEGRAVEYEDNELDEVTLAYATTIHKSQGSEYPVVVIPLLMTHFVMLQRNLVYTGITRAKKICIIVGTTKALAYSVHNMVVLKRNTKLKERLTT